MKILNVNKFYHVRGGADRYYFDLARVLERQGNTVIPFSTEHPKNAPSEYREYFVPGFTEDDFHELGIRQKAAAFLNGIYSQTARLQLRRLIFETAPDIAHLHGLFYQMSLSVIDELFDRNVPVVYSLHDYHTICSGAFLYYDGKICSACKGGHFIEGLKRKCYRGKVLPGLMAYAAKKVHQWRRILDKVDIFIVPHDLMKEEFVSWGFPREKFRTVWNPFFYDDISVYPYHKDSDYFVFYGRLARSKGIYTVLEAFRGFPDKWLWIFGSGPEEEGVREYIARHAMRNVRLNTHMRWGTELKEKIGQSLGVISASEWPTPSEYVNYETMALGMPLIVSDVAGNVAMIKDNENGFIFRHGDARDLAACLQRCLKADAGEMGRRARRFVEQELSPDIFSKRILSIYDEVLKKRGYRKGVL